jgi:hypothetical protein
MQQPTNLLSFIYTLIFTIIMSTVAVVILLLLFVDSFSEYFVLLIVLELGILAVVIWALAEIVNYAAKIGDTIIEMQNAKIKECPDMWAVTKGVSGTGTTYRCNPNVTLNKVLYKLRPSNDAEIDLSNKTVTEAGGIHKVSGNLPKFSWTALEAVQHLSTTGV